MQETYNKDALEDDQRVLHLLTSIAKCTRSLIFLKLSQVDFHNGQYDIICALNSFELVSISEIAERVNVRPSTASKAIERLVQKQILDRFEDPVDTRRTLIRLTNQGISAKSQLQQTFASLRAELFGKMPTEEFGQTVSMLAGIEQRLKSRLRRLR